MEDNLQDPKTAVLGIFRRIEILPKKRVVFVNEIIDRECLGIPNGQTSPYFASTAIGVAEAGIEVDNLELLSQIDAVELILEVVLHVLPFVVGTVKLQPRRNGNVHFIPYLIVNETPVPGTDRPGLLQTPADSLERFLVVLVLIVMLHAGRG